MLIYLSLFVLVGVIERQEGCCQVLVWVLGC
jgi:hypothetical protein